MINKKLLINAIAGIASLATFGISTFALAGGDFAPAPTPIAGCDNGNPNFYVAGRVGYGNNYWNNLDYDQFAVTVGDNTFISSRRTKHTGFAGGVEIGYAFNRYLAVEAGFMGLPRSKVEPRLNINGLVTPFPGTYGFFERTINNYAFDISGKISILFPNSENVGLFAKAGVGFLQSKHKHHHHNNGLLVATTPNNNFVFLFRNPFDFFDTGQNRHRNVSNTNLTVGFGIYWNFTPNMTLDGRFQRWFGNPHAHNNVPNNRHGHQPYMDAYTVGLTYHIDGSGDLFNT